MSGNTNRPAVCKNPDWRPDFLPGAGASFNTLVALSLFAFSLRPRYRSMKVTDHASRACAHAHTILSLTCSRCLLKTKIAAACCFPQLRLSPAILCQEKLFSVSILLRHQRLEMKPLIIFEFSDRDNCQISSQSSMNRCLGAHATDINDCSSTAIREAKEVRWNEALTRMKMRRIVMPKSRSYRYFLINKVENPDLLSSLALLTQILEVFPTVTHLLDLANNGFYS